AVLAQDPSIVGAFVGTHPESQVQNPDTKWDYVLLTPLEGPDGHGHFAQNNPFQQPAIAVTKENEHPEMTMRWLDHLYSEEMIKPSHCHFRMLIFFCNGNCWLLEWVT